MTVEAAILSLYLALPVLSPFQEQVACEWHRQSPSEQQRVRQELYAFLQVPAASARGSSLAGEYGRAGGLPSVMELFGEGATARMETASDGSLRLFRYGEERLAVGSSLDSTARLVSVNEDVVVQTRYDEAYRPVEQTRWQNGATTAAMRLVGRKRYRYQTAAQQFPDSVREELPLQKQLRESFYTPEGLLRMVRDYDVERNRELLARQLRYDYDGQLRLVEEEERLFRPATASKKTRYDYGGRASLPDTRYYEDDVLRIATVYEDDDVYTRTTYFDKGYAIRTRYVSGRRQSETVLIDGVERTQRLFDD